MLFIIQQRPDMFVSTFLFLNSSSVSGANCTSNNSVQMLSSCLTTGSWWFKKIKHYPITINSWYKVFLQDVMSKPCKSCFYHVVYVVITNGSTSLSIIVVHIFLLWMLSDTWKKCFFLLLSRYCSNKIRKNEKLICFGHIYGCGGKKSDVLTC